MSAAVHHVAVCALLIGSQNAESSGSVSQMAVLTCPIRQCLPPDKSGGAGGGQLCFSNTGGREAFGRCEGRDAPACTRCSTTPPCESFCEAAPSLRARLGDRCHLDKDCEGTDPMASCHNGICRRTLWAGQACDVKDELSVCLFGGEKCVDGFCEGFGTNQPCWDGYLWGLDLDCQIGWYCLRGVCVPQLPSGHTCHGQHPNECVRGHRCNLSGKRPQCTLEYSLEDGTLSSQPQLCRSSHMDTRLGVCSPVPEYDGDGGECRSSSDCPREDGSTGECRCKQWWTGEGDPGFCEMSMPDREMPLFMQFWNLRSLHCHHAWPDERCAMEIEQVDLLDAVKRERQATADPTLPVPDCARDMLDVSRMSVSAAMAPCAGVVRKYTLLASLASSLWWLMAS